jgi:hypothetical protein
VDEKLEIVKDLLEILVLSLTAFTLIKESNKNKKKRKSRKRK